MYARLQTVGADQVASAAPAGVEPEQARAALVETIAGHPGFAGLYLLTDDTGAGTLLTLWHHEEDARRASERTAAQLGPRPMALASDDVFEVAETWTGLAAAEPAGAAAVLRFDGPLSQERVEAMTFAGRERITPATADLPGNVGGYVLWHPGRRAQVVVVLATSVEALRHHDDTVMSTELLPGEDATLLPQPDGMTSHLVIGQAIASPARQ
jgi:hypothetical protein